MKVAMGPMKEVADSLDRALELIGSLKEQLAIATEKLSVHEYYQKRFYQHEESRHGVDMCDNYHSLENDLKRSLKMINNSIIQETSKQASEEIKLRDGEMAIDPELQGTILDRIKGFKIGGITSPEAVAVNIGEMHIASESQMNVLAREILCADIGDTVKESEGVDLSIVEEIRDIEPYGQTEPISAEENVSHIGDPRTQSLKKNKKWSRHEN